MSRGENHGSTETGPGNFGECLVGGSPEEQARRRKTKRRALVISIALQSLGLGALVIVPLLAKPAELSVRTVPPMPLYSSRPNHPRDMGGPPPKHTSGPCFKCAMNSKPIVEKTSTTYSQAPVDDSPLVFVPGIPETPGIPVVASRPQPPPAVDKPAVKRIVHTSVDPAMLVYRVEPVFPPLALQIRRNGKVELHAIIATDGSIQSLDVAGGDPMFIQSALAAVRQWRYRPTMLNGQPVEIDTFITVVYRLNQ